ncbi:MAG: Ig-like domain-containing protein [Arenicellales bacterium WSBS_2016_MAG_OTU3]
MSVTYDGTAPTVTLASTTTTADNRDPFAVTATFSEPVTGFDATPDITVTNATVTIAGTGTTYTLTITPATDGTITITIGGCCSGRRQQPQHSLEHSERDL